MNKKGFTLVELLAVIAILAILVIMALPAVLRMYRQSRINSFQNEVRTVYRTAQSQFLGDSISLGSGQTIAYTNAGTSVTGVNVVKELDMTGNTDFKYYVLINVDGKVLNVRASNGTYSFSKQAVDTDHDLKIEDIDVETNNDSTLDSDIITTVCPTTESIYGSSVSVQPPHYLYSSAGEFSIGDTEVKDDVYVFDNFDNAKHRGKNLTIAFITNADNEITNLYVAFKKDNKIFYIEYGNSSSYSKNKEELDKAFPGICQANSNDTAYNCDDSSVSGFIAFASVYGSARISIDDAFCTSPGGYLVCSFDGGGPI